MPLFIPLFMPLSGGLLLSTLLILSWLPAASMAGIGCTLEEISADHCIDDRVAVEPHLNNRHRALLPTGLVICARTPTSTGKSGTFNLVTSARIRALYQGELAPALVAAHVFFDDQGMRYPSCEAYQQRVDGKYNPLTITAYRLPEQKASGPLGDWGIIKVQSPVADSLQAPGKEYPVAYALDDIASRQIPMFSTDATKLTLVGWSAENGRMETDESCLARPGAAGLFRTAPAIILHQCDALGGMSGGALLRDDKIVGIHLQITAENFRQWDFPSFANIGVFISTEHIRAIEDFMQEDTPP